MYAMLSVVLDHSLQHMFGESVQSSQLYNWIFLSQMPIFMFVSGYFALHEMKKEYSAKQFRIKIEKKVLNLFIPFLSFAILSSILSGKNIVFKAIINPQNSLWFLWALMWIQIIMLISQQITKSLTKDSIIRVAISIGVYMVLLVPLGILFVLRPSLFDTKLIIFYSAFFLFGYFYSSLERVWKILKSDKWKVICLPVLFFMVAFVMIKHPTIIYDDESLINILYRLIGSFATILLMLYLSSVVIKIKWIEKIAKYGEISLEMYYTHLLLIRIPFFDSQDSNIGLFLMKYLILVICSLLLILLIKKCWITDLLFYGKLPIGRKNNYSVSC